MPNLDSNDPTEFGWSYPPADIVDFTYRGHPFYSGISRRAIGVFTTFLDRLVAIPGFQLHSGSGPDDGDWGYESRPIGSTSTLSFHAYGLALDINAPWNPQYSQFRTDPTYGLPDSVDEIALQLGLLWGGNERFGTNYDRMHVECHMSPQELKAGGGGRHGLPYPLSAGHYFGMQSTGPGAIDGQGTQAGFKPEIRGIQARVGAAQDGLYGPLTTRSVVAYQQRHRLAADGLVGRLTWSVMFG